MRGQVTRFGAAFDMETDAFLILVLSVYAVPVVGRVGAPDRARPLPAAARRRRLALADGADAAAPVGQGRRRRPGHRADRRRPPTCSRRGRGRRRAGRRPGPARRVVRPPGRGAVAAAPGARPRPARLGTPGRRRRRGRGWSGSPWWCPTIPTSSPGRRPARRSRSSCWCSSLLAVVLPSRWGRVLAVVGGILLTATLVLTGLDLGFYEAFDRPFNPLTDPGYVGSGLDLVHRSAGRGGEVLAVGGVVLGCSAALALCVWATVRLRRAIARRRRGRGRAGGGADRGLGRRRRSAAPRSPASPWRRRRPPRWCAHQVDEVRAELHDRAGLRARAGPRPLRLDARLATC